MSLLPSVKNHFALLFSDTCISCERKFVRTTIWKVIVNDCSYYVCRHCAKSADKAIIKVKARLNGTKDNKTLIGTVGRRPLSKLAAPTRKSHKHHKIDDNTNEVDALLVGILAAPGHDQIIELGMAADVNTGPDDVFDNDLPGTPTNSNIFRDIPVAEPPIVEDHSSYSSKESGGGYDSGGGSDYSSNDD